jgi:hypothetical protein
MPPTAPRPLQHQSALVPAWLNNGPACGPLDAPVCLVLVVEGPRQLSLNFGESLVCLVLTLVEDPCLFLLGLGESLVCLVFHAVQ